MNTNKTQYVRDKIFRDILEGKYQPGSKLPTEKEMSEMTSMSRITIRRALSELEKVGIVDRTQGRGTFVSTSLAGSRHSSNQVALLTALNGLFELEFVRLLERELAKADMLLVLKVTDENPQKEKSAAIELVAQGVRDIIIWPSGSSMPYETFRRLRILGTNMIFVDRIIPGDCADYVGLDHKTAIVDLIEQAQADGYREFVFINCSDIGADSNAMRQEAFEDYCISHSLKYRIVFINFYSPALPQVKAGYKSWLEGMKKTAIVGVNEATAVAASEVLPPEIGVYGIDGFAASIEAGITTVAQPIEKMVSETVRLIKKQRELGEKWRARNLFIKGKLLRPQK